MKCVVCLAFLVCVAGCASTSEVQKIQGQLDAANVQLKEKDEKIQLMKERASEDESLCVRAAGMLHNATDAAGNAYNAAKPVVVEKATEAYDWAKKEIKDSMK